MKNKELYNKTVDILVQAYFNDTLRHGDCKACAVGNLIQANGGFNNFFTTWTEVFITVYGEQAVNPTEYYGEAKREIDSTGYAWPDLAKIEKAFESANGINDEKMFNGLMAVIEVLDQIHENTDQEVTKVSKQKFVKA